ncbi:EamA family transporter [Providencia hangzhouensis]
MFSSRRPIDFLWIALVITGLLFLLPIGDNINSIDPLGAIYALGAGVCWGDLYYFWSASRSRLWRSNCSYRFIYLGHDLLPIGLVQTGFEVMFDPSILPLALAVAILSTAFPYTLEMIALTRLPARTFGTLMSLEPCMGAFLGIRFLTRTLNNDSMASFIVYRLRFDRLYLDRYA